MLFAEDRVLVGVVGRKRDVTLLRERSLYRIPVNAMPDGVQTDVLGFFLPSHLMHGKGGIYYYAVLRGVELQRRRDILPEEPNHPRANERYWLCQCSTVRPTNPPILNPTHHAFAFIRTTWDRFADALTISDLYVKGAYYVSRMYYGKPSS
jgi:hypothetical protein